MRQPSKKSLKKAAEHCPYTRIVLARRKGKGVLLSAEAVSVLGIDHAVLAAAQENLQDFGIDVDEGFLLGEEETR